MAIIQMNFANSVNNLGDGEQTDEEAKTNVITWAKDAVDDFFADVQTNDSSMYANMITSNGDANYQTILDSFPSGRGASIQGADSLYIRNENVRHLCSDNQWTTKATCEAEGTCTDTQYNNNQVDCEANSETFSTAGNTWEAIAPNFIINKIKRVVNCYHTVLKGF